MDGNSLWRVEGFSFGGNLKESPTHYEKGVKRCSDWDCGASLCGVLFFILKCLREHSLMLGGDACSTSWSCRGGWWRLGLYPLCLWLGLSFRVYSYTGKEMGIRAWKSGSLLINHLLGYFPAQSFLFLRTLFFKVMIFPKAMTLRTLYIVQQCKLTGDRFGWRSELWEWDTWEYQYQSWKCFQ